MNTTDSQRDLNTQSAHGLGNKHFGGTDAWRLQRVKPPVRDPGRLGRFRKNGIQKNGTKAHLLLDQHAPSERTAAEARHVPAVSWDLAMSTVSPPNTPNQTGDSFLLLNRAVPNVPPQHTNPSARLKGDTQQLVLCQSPQKSQWASNTIDAQMRAE